MYKLITSLIILFYVTNVNSQIAIGPEAGLYYRPYLFRVVSNGVRKKNIDYSIGIMGEVNLGKKLYAQTRIAYIFRDEAESGWIRTFKPDMKDAIMINKEMTLNVDVLYEPVKKTKVGLGVGMIHKLNAHVIQNFYYSDPQVKYFSPSAYYNMSLLFNQNLGRFGVTARYFFLFNSENIESTNSRVMDDKSGFTLGIHYKLFGYAKK